MATAAHNKKTSLTSDVGGLGPRVFVRGRAYLREILAVLGEGRRKLPWLLVLFLSASLLDLAGLGLIGPYLALVMNPKLLSGGRIERWLSQLGLPTDQSDTIVILSLALMGVFMTKAVMAICINRAILRFSWNQEIRLRSLLMRAYQEVPYSEYLQRNSAEYIHAIQNLVGIYASGVLQSLLRLMSEGLVALVVLAVLAWKSGSALAGLVVLLGAVVLGYDRLFSRDIREYGQQISEHSKRMVQGISEGIEGFKEIRILGKEHHFHSVVHENSSKYCRTSARAGLISSVPRFIFESTIVCFLVLLVLGTLLLGQSLEQLVPLLGMFGVAALRLIPSANVLVGGVTQLRYARHATALLYEDLQNREPTPADKTSIPRPGESFQTLELKKVCLQYPGRTQDALSDISLVLRAGESIGFVGPSGSGKTTMVDVMLGLLEPQSGELAYNGYHLKHRLPEWHSQVAYLPQQVFMTDNTLRRNVALGLEEKEIDDALLQEALQQARLTELVAKLPNGVETLMGERGVRLSGGQRQRVALARAFYFQRSVLVMDEATSALDTETEQDIIEEVFRLKGQMTIIVIAHRVSTVRYCDRIYRLEQGQIAKVGTYRSVIVEGGLGE